MPSLDFHNFSIVVNLVIFAMTAAMIWLVGTRISFYADRISDRTGLSKAFMGLLFLALATELPEIGTTVSASVAGNATLAVNNLFGGIILQTAILAIVDLTLVRGALTFFVPKPTLLLQGVLLTMLLGLTLAAATVGEIFSLFGVGLWTVLLFLAYVLSLFLSRRHEGRERWTAKDAPTEEESKQAVRGLQEDHVTRYEDWSTARLIGFFVLGAGVILVAGFALARVAEALAEQTGLGTSFVGATLLAASTSLPELSTTIAAVRLGNYSMAVSNIFGSNSIMILLIFTSDLFYRGGPILEQVDISSRFTAAMGLVVTTLYLIGLIERRNRTILRMGIDSAVVLVLYIGSLFVLYQLR